MSDAQVQSHKSKGMVTASLTGTPGWVPVMTVISPITYGLWDIVFRQRSKKHSIQLQDNLNSLRSEMAEEYT